MGILSRFSDIMRSNINAMLDKAEDPAKMVDQTLLDLRKDLAEVKKETASVMANERAAKRELDKCDEEIYKYTSAAENALRSGNESDALKLIQSKQEKEAIRISLQENYDAARESSEKCRQMHDKLVKDIESLEQRKSAIKAKVATAKAQQGINRANDRMADTGKSVAAFERMEKKADRMLDEAAAAADLNYSASSERDLVNKYADGAGSFSANSELEAMKQRLGLSPAPADASVEAPMNSGQKVSVDVHVE